MNPKHEYEVYTSTDKAQRDRLFQALRTSSDPFERQAVKFSSCEPIINTLVDPPVQLYGGIAYGSGNVWGKEQRRPCWRSTWSVAHPKSENGEYYSGGKNV